MGKRWDEGEEIFSPPERNEDLEVIRPSPLNAEASRDALVRAITPAGAHFVRTNFETPELAAQTPLTLEGAVLRPQAFSPAALRELEQKTLAVTLECAGNGRLGISPLPAGEAWGRGAVSTAVWTGVPLRTVLEAGLVRDDVCEILVEGHDQGTVVEGEAPIPFARALPLSKALEGDTLLALEMNGGPIPARHGGPVRLIVPGWYGMASVKWVRRIEARTQPFTGHFQQERYVYVGPGGRALGPVAETRVKSLLVQPQEGARLPPGRVRVQGWAWSGLAPIERVELSLDGSASWQPATLTRAHSPWAWTRFEAVLTLDAPGRHTLRARAYDAAGNVQPARPRWNQLGYGNNAIEVRQFHVG